MNVVPRLPTTPVGASLLAIAVGQPTMMLDMPPSSRAGSLPQGLWSGAKKPLLPKEAAAFLEEPRKA
ncbi:hypothetical protein FHJ31_06130 [Pseudomonas sp. Fig-3]|nr:hypothetical protein FHJ31_06130 [Pseudomonas sp. Fig-3]